MRNLSKQSFLGANLEEVLSKTTPIFIGLNGGGSHLIQQCASIGFKKWVLCDPGRIDEKKLNRNVLATLDDARQNAFKVDIASRRILGLNPDAEIISIKDKWQNGAQQGLLEGGTVILGAVDSFFERDQIERFSRQMGIPYIDIGMDLKANQNGGHYIFGQATMTFPGGPCMRCLGFLNDEKLKKEAENYGDAGDRPQVVWPNGILASTAISFLMNSLLPWNGDRPSYLYRQYDGNTFEVKDFEHASMLINNLKRGCTHY